MRSPRIDGYLVLGRFSNGKAVDFDLMCPDSRKTLAFGLPATVFATRTGAKGAIMRTIVEREQLFGENDLKFKVVPIEHQNG